MANIKPVSDLRNYNSVLSECTAGSPVYLTKNGRGRFVVLDVDEYQKMQAETRLFTELAKAENNDTWYTIEELRQKLGV
ncbi:MAG: type II toxin-antitoxin system Phd/YefM family antitoxin [Firmicutes bacterium]|nr:type II toxin-antitoxin system Phd/YefM family antitoxin [Bacillota bacterium]